MKTKSNLFIAVIDCCITSASFTNVGIAERHAWRPCINKQQTCKYEMGTLIDIGNLNWSRKSKLIQGPYWFEEQSMIEEPSIDRDTNQWSRDRDWSTKYNQSLHENRKVSATAASSNSNCFITWLFEHGFQFTPVSTWKHFISGHITLRHIYWQSHSHRSKNDHCRLLVPTDRSCRLLCLPRVGTCDIVTNGCYYWQNCGQDDKHHIWANSSAYE